MIAWIEGVLRDKAPTRIVVNANGVGYELLIPLSTYTALPDSGKTVALHVHTHARESALTLFGFATTGERDAFELLLRASRVGPKLAQTILSGMPALELVEAIESGDVGRLRNVPGVGLKTAERIVVEVRDKAAELALVLRDGSTSPGSRARPPIREGVDEVVSALVNLGYPRPRAERVAEAAVAEAGEGAVTETLIRAALRALAR